MEKGVIETDVLIIGAGIAGCRAAIEAHAHGVKVTLTTKGLFSFDCSHGLDFFTLPHYNLITC